MPRSIQLTCLFLLLCSYSFSFVQASESHLYRQGMQAFQEGDFASALDYFQQEKNQQEEDGNSAAATLYFNLGATHYQLGNYSQAANYFAKVIQDKKWGGLAKYNQGLIAEQQKNEAAALEYYREAIQKARTDKIKKLAQNRIQQLTGEAPAPQEGFVYLSASLGYDDNLSLADEDPAIDKISGGFLETLASGQIYLGSNSSHGSSLKGYLFGRQPGASEMQSEVAFSLGAQLHRTAGDWQTRGGVSFGSYQLDGSTYTQDLALETEGRYPLEGLELRLNNELKRVRGGDTYDYLDGWQNRAGIKLVKPGLWELGYQNELNQREDLAEDPAFYSYSPSRHRLYGRLNFNLSEQLLLTTRLEGRLSRYPDKEVDADGNQATEKRQDLRWRASLNASYRLTQSMSLFTELQHLNNNSNLDGYGFSSNQFTLGVDAVF
ncbi:tetratricopeptide repeat protein [Marinospirillum sp.]|uniref:tetratricopeptide repeat protein n=1 Tax=Marinospirillum sp. TaxID=2183934 RepID=UPI003850A2AA